MNIKNKLNFSKEKAAVLDLHKSPQSQVVAIGLNKGQQLNKHVTHVPTLLMVLEGEIKIIIEDKKMHFWLYANVKVQVFLLPCSQC